MGRLVLSACINPSCYLKEFNKIFLLCLFPIIRLCEWRFFNRYGNQPLQHQPVFIIGVPRTGSTILYQALTNYLDVLYIDNLTCRWHKNLFFGIWLSQKIYQSQPHNNFEAEHGNTSRFGGHAPSECGVFWYRWLPAHRHFVDSNDISDKETEKIRKEITAIINYFNKPFVFKNMNASLRMRLLVKIFPEAKFIWIKRNPYYVAQSLLHVRKKVNGDMGQWWSLMPKNYIELKELPAIEQVVAQIYFIEKQITEDKRLFPDSNMLVLNYGELANNSFIESIRPHVSKDVGFRLGAKPATISVNERNRLDNSLINQLKTEIRKKDWNDYTS